MPYWVNHDVVTMITEDTATDWVAQSNGGCRFQADWNFQWAPVNITGYDQAASDLEDAGEEWTTFGPTNAQGVATTQAPIDELWWVREQLKPGWPGFYVPTQGAYPQMYCHDDVNNADNLDRISPAEEGGTYYCVAFNIATEPFEEEPKQCTEGTDVYYSDEDTQVDEHDAVQVGFIHGAWAPGTNGISGAKWIWSEANISDATTNVTKTFTREFEIGGTPTGATLTIAADNSYSVEVNGNEVCSDEAGDSFGSSDTCVIAADDLVSGENTLEITVTNFARPGEDYTSNPAGLRYKLEVSDDCDESENPLTSDVKMCKVNEANYPQPGWTLTLLGDEIGSVEVKPDGQEYFVNDVPAGDYVFTANGYYTYRGTPGAEYSDAAYSKRDPSDPVYQAATGNLLQAGYLPWVRENDFADPYKGWLGIIFNNAFTDWGSMFNPVHEYVHGTSTNSTQHLSFKILDDIYNDNSGLITVTVNEGYTGVTKPFDSEEGSGCIVFEDVPYGTYTAGEIMQDGWENVSGLGDVTVDSPTEKFVVVNKAADTDPEDGKVHILKFIDGAMATAQTADNASFPMNTPTYSASFTLDADGWVAGDAAYEATTSTIEGGNSYSAYENLSTDLVGASCQEGKPFALVGYSTGATLAAATAATKSTGTPSVTVDGDRYIIVWNETCDESDFVKVHIYKYLKDGETTAQIPNDSSAPNFPMVSSWNAANVGSASGSYFLGTNHGGTTLRYAADTTPLWGPADYTTSEVTGTESNFLPIGAACEEGKYRLLGYKSSDISLAAAEANPLNPTAPVYTDITSDRWVIVVNEQCPDDNGGEETTSSHTTVVTPSNMQGWEFNGDRNGDSNWTLGTGEMVTGPATAPLSAGSARFVTLNNSDRIKLRKYLPIGMQISDIKGLKYSTYRAEPTGGALTMALQFDVDFDGTPVNPAKADGRIVYEPYHTQQASILDDTWQEWDALNDAAGTGTGAWWVAGPNAVTCLQSNPCTWAELNSAYPDMQISAKSLENTIDTQGAMLFKAGGSWAGFDGNVDKFSIAIKTGSNTHTETYDFEPAQPAPVYACSNDGDDDGDGLVDELDPGCHTDGDVQNSGSYDPTDNDETNGSNNRGRGGRSGSRPNGTGGGEILGAFTGPAVLGASACTEYITDYLRLGKQNDLGNVFRLQLFLNEHLGMNLPVNGVFDSANDAAVKAFQVKHKTEVLDPWEETPGGIDENGTGYVYKTTRRWINMIKCPELNIPKFSLAQLN